MDRFDYSTTQRKMPAWILPMILIAGLTATWIITGGEGPEIRKPTATKTEQ